MQKNLKKEIKDWLNLAYTITRNRKNEGYTGFLNISPLNVLDKRVKANSIKKYLNNKEYQKEQIEAFLTCFNAFCNSINDKAKELNESKNMHIKDDLLSLDEVIVLLDKGFDILLNIKKESFKTVTREVHKSYVQALQTIFEKRLSVREYLSIQFI